MSVNIVMTEIPSLDVPMFLGEEQQPKLHKSSLYWQPTGFRCIAITIGFLADIRLYSQYIENNDIHHTGLDFVGGG